MKRGFARGGVDVSACNKRTLVSKVRALESELALAQRSAQAAKADAARHQRSAADAWALAKALRGSNVWVRR